MSVKLLTEYDLEFLSLKGGCTGSSESTFVKMLHCWKSHVTVHIFLPENYPLRHLVRVSQEPWQTSPHQQVQGQ